MRLHLSRFASIGALVALTGGLLVAVGNPAAASTGPFDTNVITVHQTPSVICRAYGGALSANSEADQYLGFSVTYPTDVHTGDTFNIKIRPDVSGFPEKQATGNGLAPQATVYNIWGSASGYQLPAGLAINNVTLGPVDGSVGTNPDAGYYVSNTNVPQVTNGYNVGPDPTFDPLTLAPSKLVAIPGVAPDAYWNTSTNRVYTTLLGSNAAGTSSTGEFHGGSMVQGPTVTVSVTATANPVTNLAVTLAGSLPAGSFTGSQPGNFPAPVNGSTGGSLASTTATSPWSSTDGKRWVYSNGGQWTDPTYTTTATANALLTVSAAAACAPGWESNTDTPTEPSYYLGVNAIPNGTSPPLSSTTVDGIGVNAPFDGAHYLTGQSVNADYSCQVSSQVGNYDTCVGDLAEGAAIDTSTPGSYTFTVNATDANNDPVSRTVNYTVADPLPPVANAGAAQTGKLAGAVVTLDGSGTTDPNGPPAIPLTYTWAQTSGPTVTLSDVHAIKPTFTVAPVTTSTGDAYQFSLTVSNGFLNNTANTTVTSAPSTPTVTIAKSRPGGGSTFYEGDTVTLTPTITNPDGTNPADYTYAWTQAAGITTPLSNSTVANPTFKIPPNGTSACASGTGATNCPTYKVVVTKTNTAKSSASVTLASYASTLPTTPVANAGANQNAPNGGGVVTLNASASAQAQGHSLSYQWTQTAGPAVTLSDPTAQMPTFTAPPGGSTSTQYTFSLVVKDTQNVLTSGSNTNTSTAATTNVFVVPDHVVATATGTPASTVAGTTVTLDGSASTDPNLAPLTYAWTQVSNGAPTVTLSDPTAAKPTFVAPPATASGGYVAQFNLTVTNGGPNPGDTGSTVTPVGITVAASTPTVAAPTKARAGGGTTFVVGDLNTLSVGITNPDGTAPTDYSYVWVQSSGIPTALSSTTASNPTYIIPPQSNGTSACTSGTSSTTANCPEYKVTVTKINTGKASAQSASLANYAASLPTRPVANAGAAQNVRVGTASVMLDGSASTQAQGHPITYTWTQTGGPAVTLSNIHASQPTFAAPANPTTLNFSLTVVDSQSAIAGSGTNGNTSTASTTSVSVTTYTAPIVSAGADQSILVSGGVTLAGSASQADGHTLGLTWTQTAGPAVTLSDPTAAQPTFTAPTDGPVDLSFTLTAVDTQNPDSGSNTASSSVTVHVTNTAPDADSGPNQSVLVNTPVTLDGSGSVDIDPGQTLSYAWLQTSGTAVTLSDPSAVQPTFTAPAATGALTFQLTVDDGHGLTSTSSVEIDVFDTPPVANAGTSQTVLVDTPVALDGSGSFDPDPGQTITYTWLQTSGTPVTLSNAHAVQPTFTAPAADATLTFQLTVDDGFGGTNTATVTVTVGNSNPIAYAGPDQSGRVPGSTVTLDGSGSYDPDPGQTVTYAWSQVSGPTVALSSATAAKPTFTAPVGPAALVFQLAVDDGFGGTNTDLVTINVTGTPGLDFSGSLTGTVRGDRAFSPFSFKAVNSQTVVETISQADVHVTVTVNGVPVAPGAISITAHSFKATAGKSTVFRFNWNHGATLHAGDIIDVKACIDLVGDSVPANNCGDVLQPSGTTTLTNTVVNSAATITHRAASNRIYATIKNTGTAIVTPMKNTNVTITVTVNGGAPQVVNTTARDVTLMPGLTVRLAATWAHAPLHIGDVVVLQSCVNVPGNTGTACSTATYVVT